MITKREKLQYAYVFLADALALAISVALVLLLFGQALKILLPYDFSDWVQALTLLAIAFIVSFLSFNQNENIVSRRLGQEIKLSIKFNFLMTALYAVLILVTKARMVESRYFRNRCAAVQPCHDAAAAHRAQADALPCGTPLGDGKLCRDHHDRTPCGGHDPGPAERLVQADCRAGPDRGEQGRARP